MKFVLLLLIPVLFIGIMSVLVFYLVQRLDPMKNDKSEDKDITAAQDFLPFEDIRDEMIVLPNKCYRAAIECSSLNYDLKTNGEREQIELAFQQFINSLTFPVMVFLQTREIDNSKRMETLKKDIESSLKEFPNLQTYAEQYMVEVKNLNSRIGNSQQKKRYLIVPYDEVSELTGLTDLEKDEYASREIQNRCNMIESGLSAVGIQSHKLNTSELFTLLYSCYNRDNYSYADAIASGEAFSAFVDGNENRFAKLSRVDTLDLILGTSITQIQTEGIDNDPIGKAVLDQLKALRSKYAGHFIGED